MRRKVTIVLVLMLLFVAGWVVEFAFDRTIQLRRADGSIHVLLLGISGGIHEGAELTDTIIFASINPAKNKVALISLPRDLWIPKLSEKINAAYAIGNQTDKQGGMKLTKKIVTEVLNQPVGYVFVIDFDGFVKAVDLIGGLDIVVDATFDDYEYPIEKKQDDLCGRTPEEATKLIATQEASLIFPCRYQHVRFENGFSHMDGEKALTFVRSRNAEGEEGTDFARSLRQQKVLKSFRDKLFSKTTLSRPLSILSLSTVVLKSVRTDVAVSEFDDLLKLAEKMKGAEMQSFVIDSGLLTNPPLSEFGGKWVLLPKVKDGTFKEVQDYVSCIVAFEKLCKI